MYVPSILRPRRKGAASNIGAYASRIAAQNDMLWFQFVGSMTFMIAGVRLFKYFASHPRLGEVSEPLAISSVALGHFFVVLVRRDLFRVERGRLLDVREGDDEHHARDHDDDLQQQRGDVGDVTAEVADRSKVMKKVKNTIAKRRKDK